MYDILCDIWKKPERGFSAYPVWVLDGELSIDELTRQLDILHRKGIDGVILKPDREKMHPKVMSEEYFAILSELLAAAKKRFMSVCFCDTGVGKDLISIDRRFSARTLHPVPAGETSPTDEIMYRIYLSFDEKEKLTDVSFGPKEGYREYSLVLGYEKNATGRADLLNPASAEEIIQRVHEKYHSHLSEYFGNTVIGFVSENTLTADADSEMIPWTYGFIEDFFEAGGDFHMLAAMFFEAKEKKYRREGERALRAAIEKRLGEAFCTPLSKWCAGHSVAHIGASSEYNLEKYFDVPGKIPGKLPESLSGEREISAFYGGMKAVSDYAAHNGVSRSFSVIPESAVSTSDELINSLNLRFMRGVNMIILPELSYIGEKDGLSILTGSPLWSDFRKVSEYIKRMSWLNFAGSREPECAVLCNSEYVPHTPTKGLLAGGYSFNYLSTDDLMEKATVSEGKIRIDRYSYSIILIDSRLRLNAEIVTKIGHFITGGGLMYRGGDFATFMEKNSKKATYFAEKAENLRFTRIKKSGCDFIVLMNEGDEKIEGHLAVDISSAVENFDPITGNTSPMLCEMAEGGFSYPVAIPPHSVKIMGVNPGALPKIGSEKKLPLREIVSLADGRMSFDQKSFSEKEVILSFGEISRPTDVRVNGELAGRLLFKPYELDITSYIKEGENEVSLDEVEFSGCTVKIYGSN